MINNFEANLNIDLINVLNNYHNKKDISLLEDILVLQDIFNEQKIKNNFIDSREMDKLINKYKKINKKNYRILKKDILNNIEDHLLFAKLSNLIDSNLKEEKLENFVSLVDSLDIANDFMNNYNIKLYDTFEWMKNNKHIKIKKNSSNNFGGCVYLTNTINPYMVVNIKNNIYDASCFVHETAHIVHDHSNILKNPSHPYLYQEVYSNYVQMLFCKYMEDNNLYKDDIKKLKIKKLISLRIFLKRIEFNLERNYFYEENFQYGYGIALALYYYNMYLNDPELAEYYMDWFIKCSPFFEQKDILNRFGIEKEKIITQENINNFLK